MARTFEIVTKLHKKNRFDIFNLFQEPVTTLPEAEKKQVAEKFAAVWFKEYKNAGGIENQFLIVSNILAGGNLTIRIEVF